MTSPYLNTSPSHPARVNRIAKRRKSSGAALIIALAIMVLVMALVVGLLSMVTTERTASGGYDAAVRARLLAETAVQMVQAQVGVATSEGTRVAWSSQPGLIRTFGDNGAPLRSFKLYSGDAMQTVGALDPANEAAVLANWFDSPALFTDINMPADSDFDGNPDRWPVLDPSAAGVVEGFSVTNAPMGNYLGINNPIPMPVKWLYVLQDGQVVAPAGAGTTASVAGATASNPIVGRIAFWTDDETSKINVNTASEGTYWDIPRARNETERRLALYQPTQHEFQAYPGHPATTSLSPAFPGLTRAQILALTPRIQEGGSTDGTVDVNSATPVSLDQDRLYATTEESLFSSAPPSSNGRVENAGITEALLEQGKFFITTVSRAPETNLFNLPKIACWPLHAGTARTSFDRLIAFCSTINNQPYHFQRQNSKSATEDYASIPDNKTLYASLRTLMARKVPGFGGNLASKYGTDADQILTEMFDYIRCTNLNDLALADSQQYAAPTTTRGINLGEAIPIEIGSTRGFGRYVTISEAALWVICTADAANSTSNDPGANLTLDAGVTLQDTGTGTGATKEIRLEAAVLLEPFIPMLSVASIRPDVEILVSGLENWRVQGNADAASVNLGFPSKSQQTETDAGIFLLGKSPDWTSGNTAWGGHLGLGWALDGHGAGRQIRARNGGRLPRDPNFLDSSDGAGGTKNLQYPFVSEPVTVKVTKTNPQITLTATNTITVSIRQRATGIVIQNIELDFSPFLTLPAPSLRSGAPWTFQAGGCGVESLPQRRLSAFPRTFAEDIIYSLVPASGGQTADPRHIAMTGNVGPTVFNPHPNADGANKIGNSLIGLALNGFQSFRGANTGTLADLGGALHPGGANPVPKAPFPSASRVTGDWDNGMADQPDGGYLNAPDGGNQYIGGTQIPYFTPHSDSRITFTSPNRIMPSPGMFGSLPTGVKRGRPWETLLFRRQPGHPNYPSAAGGFINNPDYLLLDLFWMPVVEPYAISEPLSSAGKINMNHQLVPFSYIERSTGIHAVLKREKIFSVPTSDYQGPTQYKLSSTTGTSFAPGSYRHGIDIPATLTQFQQRFDNSDGSGLYAFRTPAEICDMHLVPDDAAPNTTSKASMDTSLASYWDAHALTGDNSRERIYTTVYPRLTTKSNTFTVHFRAQSLKKRPGSDPAAWDDLQDVVTADYRGSTTLERYIDPNIAAPDYASDPDATPTLDSLYRWRERANRRFAP